MSAVRPSPTSPAEELRLGVVLNESADLGSMLKLRADRGSFEELLRSPIRGNHDSLL